MYYNTQKKNIALAICPIWNVNQPPLSLAYIGAVLSEHGYNVTCHDFSQEFFNSLPDKEKTEASARYVASEWLGNISALQEKYAINEYVSQWAHIILSNNPHAVGISVYSSTKLVSILLARKIKKLSPNTVIVFGGPSCDDFSLAGDARQMCWFAEKEK